MKKSATTIQEVDDLASDLEKRGYKTSLKSYFQSKADEKKYSPQKDDELSKLYELFTGKNDATIKK